MLRGVFRTGGKAVLAAAMLAAPLATLGGCATVSPETRSRDAIAFQAALDARTHQSLPEGGKLTLDQCIAIALDNNLALRAAQVDATIARLDTKAAFADFLPRVSASATATAWRDQPLTSVGGLIQTPMHDKTLREYGMDAQMPVLVPSTWFLYSMRRHGAGMRALAAELTRQAVVLDVTARYYGCLTREAEAAALHSQWESAKALAGELKSLHAEGLVLDWELAGAKANAHALQTRLHERQGLAAVSRSELLQALGLDPTAQVTLVPETPLEPPSEPVEALIYQALLAHPALHLADRDTAMAEDRVKRAITAFLPGVSVFTSLTHSSNTTTIPAGNVYGGVASVLSIFDGFANVRQYQIARQQQEKAALAREERCLEVITAVYGAYLKERLAREYLATAQEALAVQNSRLATVNARASEGTALASERLDALAQRDAAQMQLTTITYRHQLSAAVLRYAMGVPPEGEVPACHANESSR